MRKIVVAATGLAAVAGLLIPATVASAAPGDPAASGNTTVNLTVADSNGNLNFFAAPQGSASLAVGIDNTAAESLFVATTARDDRGGGTRGFTIKASLTDFKSGVNTISNANASIYIESHAESTNLGTNISFPTSSAPATLDQQRTLYNVSGVSWPLTSFTYTPKLKVKIPASNGVIEANAGSYSATLTQSIY